MAKIFVVLLLFYGSAFAQDAPTRIRAAIQKRDFSAADLEVSNLRKSDKKLFFANNFDYLMARLSEQRGDFASAMLNYQSVVKRKSVLREYALWHLAHISRTTGNLLLERNYLRQLQIFAPRSLLNDAARALSQLADVYYEEAPGRIARIPHADLIGGAFCNGAREFRASNGRTYRDLALRRLDLMNALDVLEKANTALASVRTSEGPGSGPRTQAPRGS